MIKPRQVYETKGPEPRRVVVEIVRPNGTVRVVNYATGRMSNVLAVRLEGSAFRLVQDA